MRKALLQGMSIALIMTVLGIAFIIKSGSLAKEAPWVLILIGILLIILGIIRFKMFYKIWIEEESSN